METLTIRTGARAQMIDITDRIQELVRSSGVQAGVARIHVPHTTAGVTINENADPSVQHDILADLDRLVAHRQAYYRHSEGNSAAHLKASLMGCFQIVPVESGRLVLGTWQGIYLCEFDGPRSRQVLVGIAGG